MKKIKDLLKDLEKLEKEIKLKKTLLLKNIGVIASNYFQDRITQGKDIDGEPFKQRSPEFSTRQGRKILIKSGNLRRSIRVSSVSNDTVTISSNMPYAQIHNEGGQIPITPKMRRFFWAKAKKARNKTDRSKWKGLALKTTPINIPKRQFMGMNSELEGLIENEVKSTLVF